MNFEGLHAILNKEEVIPTRQARDFLDNPQEIDDLYKHHVRTYIPLRTGTDEASGVIDFASRFIRQIKEARAPRGYITADFGYGKTSAGLFVWQKAQDARFIVVPPFRLNRLEDLLDATAGWVAYILGKAVPQFVERVIEIYRFYHDRELEGVAKRYGVTLEQAERMYNDQALQLNIVPKEIVRFFSQMTDLVQEAGFEGLVIIPDELQQYLEPEIKSGKVDPLVPLFDIVTELMNQQGKLAFGFLMIITSKELGVINDQRGDLIDRLRGNTLDLRAIYDREFPARLWMRFAESFDYVQLASQMIDAYTLESLGQIASRQDLSNGPRTVINVFRRIAQRVIESDGQIVPYTPIDLIDDFIANRISFDARKVIQEVTSTALAASVVRGNTALTQAVKLVAAFPVDGVTREIQAHYELAEACAELKISGFPEIVLEIGDRNRPALILRGLDAAQENTDELTLILREFVRNYQPQAASQLQRAVNAFISLLSLIFKQEHWTVEAITYGDFARNAEIVYNGAFPEMVRRFPERFVHVRILGDDERVIDSNLEGECHLTFTLRRYFDLSHQERQSILGEMQLDENSFSANFTLNLMLPCFDVLNRASQDQLRRVMDIEQVTPLLVLSLYAYLQDVAERDGVSKPLKEMIKRSMAVRLLEAALEILFNPAVGVQFNAAGGRIIEQCVGSLIETRYGDQYHTLITYKQWRDSLRSYISALKQLPNFSQKQGFSVVEGTKDDIARLFSTTASSFDAFQSRFSQLLQIEGDTFPSRAEVKAGRKGGVRFTRHPLEEIILASFEGTTTSTKRDGKTLSALRLDDVYGGSAELGYRRDEIKFTLDIMEARDLVEVDGGWVREKPRTSVSIDALNEQVQLFKREADLLYQANGQPDAKHMSDRAEQYVQRLKGLYRHRNEAELIVLDEQIQADRLLLQAQIEREINELRKRVAKLELVNLPPEWSEILVTMIRAGTFTSHINQVRLLYEQMMRQWNNEVAAYRERLSELISEQNDLSLSSLQRFSVRINQLTKTHLDLNDQRRTLEGGVQQTEAWQEVVNQFHELMEAIQRLGEPAKHLLSQLQEIEVNITKAFEKHPSEAFDTAPQYKKLLSQLEQQIEGFASQAERKFNREQENYRNLLIQKTGVKPAKLWQKIIYSSHNPDGVYGNLYQAVEEQMADLLDELSSSLEREQIALIALRTMPIEHFENDGEAMEQELERIDGILNSLNDEYTYLAEGATSPNIRNAENFEHWLDIVVRMQNELRNVHAAIQQIREPPEGLSFSPDEQLVINALTQLGANTNLIRLRQALDTVSEDTFWSVVKSLWEKQIVEVNIKFQ
jgi:hypothetical protein